MSERMNLRVRLVALCFLMLFVELALIRWLGGNVLYLSYFSNVVLLGSFLGIGLGFLYVHRTGKDLLKYTPLALAALVVVVRNAHIKLRSDGSNLIFFGTEYKPSGPPREVVLPLVFLVVALILMCIGSGVATVFKQMKNLDAYQLDLIGSLVGIIAFTALSFIGTPPVVWGSVAAATLLWTAWPKGIRDLALLLIPIAVMLVTLGIESGQKHSVWTPYYKVKYTTSEEGAVVYVNDIGHWGQTASNDYALYQTAYKRRTSKDPVTDLLVIGAGSGNDVSVGLSNGVEHVDAVEIDPKLLKIAKKYHPNQPYSDPRVDTHINDGRAYIEGADKKWNMIVLALTDSLTLVQGASSIRLESYLFTKEAAEAYRKHLDDGGTFAMYNFYREPWLVDRYAATLESAFGHAPCVTKLNGLAITVLTVGVQEDNVTCKAGEKWVKTADSPKPVTDDRPFPYLKNPSIPSFYLVSLALVILVSLLLIRGVGGPMGGMREYADLFFMGVAFLLLETKNVVQFALLFGTTWLVNALVFASVLGSVLLAVTLSKRLRRLNLRVLYGLLGVSIVIGWLIPQHSLLSLSFVPRLLLASAIAFAPIFVANVIFAQRFRDTGDSAPAFAANLFGAILGGVLEYTSLVLGYRNLLIVAFVLYGCAVITGRKHLTAAAA